MNGDKQVLRLRLLGLQILTGVGKIIAMDVLRWLFRESGVKLKFYCELSNLRIGYLQTGSGNVSIAICMKINDGIVLASDSASTLMGRMPNGQIAIANTYNNANKIFNLRKGLPIGLITWGTGSIGTNSTSTLVKDLRRRLTGHDPNNPSYKIDGENYTVQGVASLVRKFMYEECYLPAFRDWPNKPAVGFMVAGYSSNADMGDEYFIEINNGQCPAPRPLHDRVQTGVTWGD